MSVSSMGVRYILEGSKVVLPDETDITPKNIFLQLRSIDSWSVETLYQQVGQPIRDEVLTSSGEIPDPSAPEYLVESASFSPVDPAYISDHALLIDLGKLSSRALHHLMVSEHRFPIALQN